MCNSQELDLQSWLAQPILSQSEIFTYCFSIAVLRLCWLEWTDSNCRMHVYQTCALTNFATLHHVYYLLAEGRRFELPGHLYDDRLLSKELL